MTISTHTAKTTTWRMDFSLGLRDGGGATTPLVPGSPEAAAAIERAKAKSRGSHWRKTHRKQTKAEKGGGK